MVDDGFSTRKSRLYGGDLTIVGPDRDAYAAYGDCVMCHEEATTTMLAKGGKHNAIGCADCHTGHPPEIENPYAACTDCHEPHSNQMDESVCSQCHRAHTATQVTYWHNVPSEYCAACHQDAATELAKSQSRHSDIACVLCHQNEHKTSPTCQYCHGAPHPEHVMKNSGICAACHQTAHDLESARQQ